MPAVNSRNVITRHLDSGLFRSCPVCQHAIALDHDEALNDDLLYALTEIEAEPLDDTDFVVVDPDRTLPPTS